MTVHSALSPKELDQMADDMLAAALMYAASKIGKIDGDLASHMFDDDNVQKRFRDFLATQTNSRIPDVEEDVLEYGIFRDHSCWKCQDGKLPCVAGHPNKCEYPHARND